MVCWKGKGTLVGHVEMQVPYVKYAFRLFVVKTLDGKETTCRATQDRNTDSPSLSCVQFYCKASLQGCREKLIQKK